MASRKNRDTKSVSISGDAPGGHKPKTTNNNTESISQNPKYADISPRYLKPPLGSCHDKCKNDMREKSLELEKHAKISRSRKTSPDVKIPKTKTKTKKPTSFQQPKIRTPQNGQRKIKSIKIDNKYKATRSGLSPRMTKNKLKQMIAKKNQEMTKTTLDEGETAELEFGTPIIATELTVFTNSESSESSEKQVSDLEPEEINNENYEVEKCEEEEDEGLKVKFKQGTIVEIENCKIPTWVKFNRGTILEKEEKPEEEKVTLKPQEQIKKEAKDLLNRVIEETASKLAEDKKTKVGALVGAFETVISLQEDNANSP